MKKLIFAAAAVAISSSAAFAQYSGLANRNADNYWLYSNGAESVQAYAQAQHGTKARHVTTKSSAKRAAVGQPTKM